MDVATKPYKGLEFSFVKKVSFVKVSIQLMFSDLQFFDILSHGVCSGASSKQNMKMKNAKFHLKS